MNPPDDPHGWVPKIEDGTGPIYLAVADAIGTAVARGELRAGARLPTHRALAGALRVDLTTITRAYAEARRRGLLQATVGRGTFVRAGLPAVAGEEGGPERVVDLGMNLPPHPADLPLPEVIQRGLDALLADADPASLLTYREGAGTRAERAAGAAWLRPTLGETDPERVLLSPGAQPALLAALSTMAKQGDAVLADALTYPGIRGVADALGLRLVGVPGDADGMLPDAAEAACRAQAARVLYLTPTIHNPTAATMPPARRRAIVAVARRQGLRILEDDAYGLLPSEPIPALASLAPEITVHVATLSKVLSPVLRVAYLVAPDAAAARTVSAALRAGVLMASPLLSGLMTAWIGDGTAGAIVSAVRRECAARQQIASGILPPGGFDAHPEGLHLWLRLPPHWDRLDFAAHLRRRDGLALVPSDAFWIGEGRPPDAVRVSIGAAASRDVLRPALQAVATALGDGTSRSFREVV
ncbi:PLP-dependent aminotransferase family protein [Roseomonas nepalensis]|uniref:PLP-dependent aminotransferase family protein n=1 Tax=Muricoccus nepalensis TaxID=1854500 RepID=A0A502G2C7_9PROT|nr:PLP-dependent aminotransferase family protein [Roseomonas nepalensis]TPG55935.1 PLP-dependent aminotransferase family protein [Roseomonas nepalensis]